jgi:hypothetical protein
VTQSGITFRVAERFTITARALALHDASAGNALA